MCILMSKLFVLSLQYFEKVFVCGFVFRLCCFCFLVAAFICVLYLCDLLHILLLPLKTYGSMECMYVCMYVCNKNHLRKYDRSPCGDRGIRIVPP
jgi:hypothetical protein